MKQSQESNPCARIPAEQSQERNPSRAQSKGEQYNMEKPHEINPWRAIPGENTQERNPSRATLGDHSLVGPLGTPSDADAGPACYIWTSPGVSLGDPNGTRYGSIRGNLAPYPWKPVPASWELGSRILGNQATYLALEATLAKEDSSRKTSK